MKDKLIILYFIVSLREICKGRLFGDSLLSR